MLQHCNIIIHCLFIGITKEDRHILKYCCKSATTSIVTTVINGCYNELANKAALIERAFFDRSS